MNNCRILAVDDEPVILESIQDYFTDYNITVSDNPVNAIKMLDDEYYEIIISDYRMPGINGLDFLLQAHKKNAYDYGILLTAFADKELLKHFISQDLIRMVLEKPLDLEQLKSILHDACSVCEKHKQEKRHRDRLQHLCSDFFIGERKTDNMIIGAGSGLADVMQKIEHIAPLNENVLITGETGTGKELVARGIHQKSPRADNVFIKINCGAIHENLIESELFGHIRGAFSDAYKSRPGKIELANTGTLFLDETGELSEHMQTRLLHVVQDHYVERIGDSRKIPVDFRLICATNRNLKEAIDSGRFRQDLFFRINTFPIHIPPLRDRIDDLVLFVAYLLQKYCRELGKTGIVFTEDTIERLKQYSWPGNVRELESVIKRAVITAGSGQTIGPGVFNYLFYNEDISQNPLNNAVSIIRDEIIEGRHTIRTIEQMILSNILEYSGNSISRAVSISGIPKDRFYRNIK